MDKGDSMIFLYSGTPGSGKSLHAAQIIINGLKHKRPIICNFDISKNVKGREYFTYKDNEQLTPEYLMQYSRDYFKDKKIQEDKILLIIDECQMLFNAREWSVFNRKAWLKFFTTHRHYGYCIVLVAQFDRMIDRQIRSLIEYEYIHRKLSNFGWRGMMLNIIFGGKTFVAVKSWYPLKEKVGSEFFHARKKLYRIYDSYQTF
jgi:zona occludens toxin